MVKMNDPGIATNFRQIVTQFEMIPIPATVYLVQRLLTISRETGHASGLLGYQRSFSKYRE